MKQGFFSRIMSFIRGGELELNELEKHLICLTKSCLPPADKDILDRQIQTIRLVQRPLPGKITLCFHTDGSNAPLFQQQAYQVCLVEISFREGVGNKKARIMLHNGRLQSFEGHLSQALLAASEVKTILWPTKFRSIPNAIDRLDHPTTDEHEAEAQ